LEQPKKSITPIQLTEDHGGKLLTARVSGKPVNEDYEHFVPEFERLAKQHRKLRVLFGMTGFHGGTPGALGADTKFAMHHFHEHRPVGSRRREEVAGGNGNFLQALRQCDCSILRTH